MGEGDSDSGDGNDISDGSVSDNQNILAMTWDVQFQF